ncbi:MAG: 4Fe-4S binding protein [Candidatus Omnitrophica bacterium]|nr:4Fe-4S binding protein [Candidatus Omnitrophota bacterium]MCM8824992.1 4Fe-4S binding protein [Candidatus Omnitrophota bacterium]
MKGIIVVDPDKCLGCKTCEIECSIYHSSTKDLSFSTLSKNPPRIKLKQSKNRVVPIQCYHCEAAPCIAACPAKAIIKDGKTSAIIIKSDLCVGCNACVIVCPYGVLELKHGKGVIKCDLCFMRLEKGQKPACVCGCPTGALKFEVIEDFLKNESERLDDSSNIRKIKEIKCEIPFALCAYCGSPIAPLKQIEHLKRKTNLPEDIFYTCAECKKNNYARKLVAQSRKR